MKSAPQSKVLKNEVVFWRPPSGGAPENGPFVSAVGRSSLPARSLALYTLLEASLRLSCPRGSSGRPMVPAHAGLQKEETQQKENDVTRNTEHVSPPKSSNQSGRHNLTAPPRRRPSGSTWEHLGASSIWGPVLYEGYGIWKNWPKAIFSNKNRPATSFTLPLPGAPRCSQRGGS